MTADNQTTLALQNLGYDPSTTKIILSGNHLVVIDQDLVQKALIHRTRECWLLEDRQPKDNSPFFKPVLATLTQALDELMDDMIRHFSNNIYILQEAG